MHYGMKNVSTTDGYAIVVLYMHVAIRSVESYRHAWYGW